MSDDHGDLRSLDSRGGFQAALRETIARAADAGAVELVMVDPDFDDWPLDERAIVDTLTRWAAPRRGLTLLAGSFENLARRAPRFVAWRRQWSHVVTCRVPDGIDADQLPTLLFAAGVGMVRLDDRLRHRGTASTRPIDQVAARETIDALSQRSIEAFPATTLGL